MEQKAAVAICIGLFGVAFLGGSLFILAPFMGTPPVAQATGESKPASRQEPEAEEEHEEDEIEEPAEQPAKPQRKMILHQWAIPGPPKNPKTSDEYHNPRARELYVNDDGTVVTTVCVNETVVWDVASGTRIRTFPAKDKTTVLVSPDNKVVARITDYGQSVDFISTRSGKITARYRNPGEPPDYALANGPAFSTRGDYLIMHGRDKKRQEHLCAISPVNGVATKLKIANDWGKKRGQSHKAIIASTGTQYFIRNIPTFDSELRYQDVYLLNTITGKDSPLTAINVQVNVDFPYGQSFFLSPNRRWLAVRGLNGVAQVAEWRENRRVLDLTKKPTIRQLSFTPDGNRLMVLHDPKGHRAAFTIYYRNSRQYDLPCYLDLYDLKTGDWITNFSAPSGLESPIYAVGVSGNGKILVLAHMYSISVLDFEAAIGVAPLPVPQHQPDRFSFAGRL